MPVILKDFRNTVEIVLPVTQGKVWIYDQILARDSIEIDKIYVSDTSVSVNATDKTTSPISLRASKYYEAQDATLKSMIAKWDFVDDKQEPLEPTPENIKLLPKQDFEFLYAEIEKRISRGLLTDDQKKV